MINALGRGELDKLIATAARQKPPMKQVGEGYPLEDG